MKTIRKLGIGGLIGFLLGLAVFDPSAISSTVSRVYTFSDGSILTAAQLNTEFNNLVDGINNIDDANISTTANILPSKLNATIAGDGLGRDGSTGVLSVNVDDSSIQISGDTLQIKDSGVTTAKINDSAVTTAKINAGAITGAKLDSAIVDNSTIAISSNQLIVKDSGITTAKINNGAITQAKRASLGQQISSSSGNWNTSSTSFTDVTNLSITITTTGRPVWIALVSDGSGNGSDFTGVGSGTSATGLIRLLRGATEISQALCAAFIAGHSGTINAACPGTSFHHIDVPSAGTYTYKIQARTADSLVSLDYVKLVAFEL